MMRGPDGVSGPDAVALKRQSLQEPAAAFTEAHGPGGQSNGDGLRD